VDNTEVARILAEVADLLDIKGENAFKIRAYRTAADTIVHWPEPVCSLDEKQLRELPGIGKDLAAKIHELAESGVCVYHQDLLEQYPAGLIDVLRLPGVGPKTVALLHAALNIRSLDEVAAVAREGRLRHVKGIGAKKEALILAAIDERQWPT
jgi:DNA polymerase (family 10)